MQPKFRKARFNQKQKKIIEQIIASVWFGFTVVIGLWFVEEIVMGIFGNWMSILWWAFNAGLAFAFVGLSYFRVGKRVLRCRESLF